MLQWDQDPSALRQEGRTHHHLELRHGNLLQGELQSWPRRLVRLGGGMGILQFLQDSKKQFLIVCISFMLKWIPTAFFNGSTKATPTAYCLLGLGWKETLNLSSPKSLTETGTTEANMSTISNNTFLEHTVVVLIQNLSCKSGTKSFE